MSDANCSPMSDRPELKPGAKVVDQYGDMGELVSRLDEDRWVVFDLDADDEFVWNVTERKVRVVSHE
jgi:hypothetical protein